MIQISDGNSRTGHLAFTDADGHAAVVQPGSTVVQSSDEGRFLASLQPDGTSFVVKQSAAGSAEIGGFQILVSADADIGDGVKTISLAIDAEFIAGDAALITATFDDQVPN